MDSGKILWDFVTAEAPRLTDDDLEVMAQQELDRLGVVPKVERGEALWMPRFSGEEPPF